MALCGEMKFSGIAMVMCSKAIVLSMDQDVGARCQASCTYCLVCCSLEQVPIWWSERLAEGIKKG